MNISKNCTRKRCYGLRHWYDNYLCPECRLEWQGAILLWMRANDLFAKYADDRVPDDYVNENVEGMFENFCKSDVGGIKKCSGQN